MASVVKRSNGCREVAFFGQSGPRKCIRLGRVSAKTADSFKGYLEALLAAKLAGRTPDNQVLTWLADLPDTMHAKLASFGLVEPRTPKQPGQAILLGAFLHTYIEGRCDVKLGTKTILGHTKRNLIAHFGKDKPLRDITPGDADQFRLFLVGQGLAAATVRRRLGISKQYFRAAVRSGYVQANPFADQKVQVKGNMERFHFVTPDEYRALLDACPSTEWRVLVAMARIGGVRVPSETQGLKWTGIDWGRSRMTIRSPKTEHHGAEHAERQVPLFPEMYAELTRALAEAEPGAEYVVGPKHRAGVKNLRTHLERIIRRAGLVPWPKPLQNMRASREIELCQTFPEHVVAKWMGHTQSVAREFYLQTRDSDFEKAAGWKAKPDGEAKKAQQRAQQTAAERPRDTMSHTEADQKQTGPEGLENSGLLVGAGSSSVPQSELLGPEGFEPSAKGL
jgi:integrase